MANFGLSIFFLFPEKNLPYFFLSEANKIKSICEPRRGNDERSEKSVVIIKKVLSCVCRYFVINCNIDSKKV